MLIIGVLYVLLGFWCLLRPSIAAPGVGIAVDNARAMSEFITLYGGFEIGIGVAMIICSRNVQWYDGALVFCLIFSAILVLARVYSLFVAGPTSTTMILAAIELIIALVFAWLFWRVQKSL